MEIFINQILQNMKKKLILLPEDGLAPSIVKQESRGGGEPLKGELIRRTKQLRPRWFVFENVPGLIAPKLSIEHSELIFEMESFGYETATFSISADKVGSKQIRERIWIVGRYKMGNDPNAKRGELGKIFNKIKEERAQDGAELFRNSFRFHWYEAISRIHGIFNGLSRRLDRHRNASLGNAIVPQVVYKIFKAIEKYEKLYGC